MAERRLNFDGRRLNGGTWAYIDVEKPGGIGSTGTAKPCPKRPRSRRSESRNRSKLPGKLLWRKEKQGSGTPKQFPRLPPSKSVSDKQLRFVAPTSRARSLSTWKSSNGCWNIRPSPPHVSMRSTKHLSK